ncbi:unnamed protein product [Linum tenue]|uniref:Uncharacterized protein n=1 Tax=Linum tenue TaxID=586396 RepID=A0AAV0ITC3_9ROSI|nr:unnamed protein product [Linum tenue]CAI0464778.1 unnamed protein product [Linum tenue]
MDVSSVTRCIRLPVDGCSYSFLHSRSGLLCAL